MDEKTIAELRRRRNYVLQRLKEVRDEMKSLREENTALAEKLAPYQPKGKK